MAVKYAIVNAQQLADPERRRWLYGSERWRESMHFRTSRETDRGTDEDAADETDVTVFENRRALPRAWMADTVTPLAEPDAIRTVKTSRLPDGASFDARRTALVDPSSIPATSMFSPGAYQAQVTRIGDGDIGLRVTSEGSGFLVLSENSYPGWRAASTAQTCRFIAPTSPCRELWSRPARIAWTSRWSLARCGGG
jgi:hypothetical protein